MQSQKFSFRTLFFKFVLFIALFYLGLIVLSTLITAYLFFSLNSYKSRIEEVIFKHTGYALTLSNIKTGLSNNYTPEIILTDIKLNNPSNPDQKMSISRVEFVLSYSSIWNLEPIFDQINIDNTNIDLEYLADGSIIFNGINVNHPDKKTIENTKDNPIDIELWILKQHNIHLSNIDLSFWDKKNNLPKLTAQKITTTLVNSQFAHTHELSINFGLDNHSNSIGAKLNWSGGKISEWQTWEDVELKLQTYDNNDPITGTIRQYLPNFTLLQQFTAETAFDAKVKNSKLQSLYANFDIKNFYYKLKKSQNFIDLPELSGLIKIDLETNNSYKLSANNLTIKSPSGFVLNKKNINGNYKVNTSGSVSILNTDLNALNNLFSMLPFTNKVRLDGNIEVIKFDWLGKIFSPESFSIFANFKDLAIKSTDENIPSINHISGNITLNHDSGKLNINLSDSTMLYNKVFIIPYHFKTLQSEIDWQFNKDKTLDVILKPTKLETSDFKGSADGSYKYKPGTIGYIDLNATLEKAPVNKVGDYLPRQIGDSVHKWLKMGLVDGQGTNAHLKLQGDLDKFPYEGTQGKFYIDATINDGKVNYVDGWPTINNISGLFQIRNHKIIILTNSASISGNKITKALVTIPDMTATGAYLTADGEASGSTANFMTYLSKTPISKMIGDIPNKVIVSGNGSTKLLLKVPFDKPETTKVDGWYNFNDNSIKFKFDVPLLTNVTGKLFYSDHGTNVTAITATTLNSKVTLSANTDKDGIIKFNIDSPNLDFKSVTDFYLPLLNPFFIGRSPTSIFFNIMKGGIGEISAKSELYGTKVNFSKPLYKESQTTAEINFKMSPINHNAGYKINFDYAKMLWGQFLIDNDSNIADGKISFGTNTLSPDKSSAKIKINANFESLYVQDWLTTTKILVSGDKPDKVENTSTTNNSHHSIPSSAKKKPSLFPIVINLNTNNLFVSSSSSNNLGMANANIMVYESQAIFNINGTTANGYGIYSYDNPHLSIALNQLNIYKSLESPITVTQQNTNNQNIKQNLEKIVESEIQEATSFESLAQHIEPGFVITGFPNTQIAVKNVSFENFDLGKLSLILHPQNSNLIIESGVLADPNAVINFKGISYCMECNHNDAFVAMQFNVKLINFGNVLEHLNYGRIVNKGKGNILVKVKWAGGLQDFSPFNLSGSVKLDLENGKFLKVDSGGIVGRFIGFINLQTIVNIGKMDFGSIFANGFYFSKLNIRAYIDHSKIAMKRLHMVSPMALVNSAGIIDAQNDDLDLYLAITPNLGAGVALGAALVTANPIVGIITYAAEWALGNPFNKLFTFSYHVTGSTENPNIEKIKISKQIYNNLNSAVGND